MKKIETQGPVGNEFASWHHRVQSALDRMISRYRETGEIQEPDPEILRDLRERFLVKVFHNKCAYCESMLNRQGNVDHYRPRGAVTVNRKRIIHPGYFWLVYEWDNLLLVCHDCNSGHSEFIGDRCFSHPGKSMEFPITGERVMCPSEDKATWTRDLRNESPLILNPYHDDPEDHIVFDDNGIPHAKEGSERGNETIKACHLDSIKLCERRRDYARDLFKKRVHHVIEEPGADFYEVDDEFSTWLKHAFPMFMKDFSMKAVRTQ
jgi:hypothetical protein